MILPLEIEFHNTPPLENVQTRIRQELAELEKFYNRIISCRVDVEVPEHPRKGSVSKVRLDLRVPSDDAVTAPDLRGAEVGDLDTEYMEIKAEHKDTALAVHSAFTTARRRLEDLTGPRTIP